MVAGSAPARDVEPIQSTDQPIHELDRLRGSGSVKGTIQYRCDHMTSTGFHVRIADKSGAIDVKFWNTGADAFRQHEGLQKGATIRIQGFRISTLTTQKHFDFATVGRSIELVCNKQAGVSIEVLTQVPKPSFYSCTV